MNIARQLQTALDHYQSGNLQQAERLFRDIIKTSPKDFEAHYYLANILQDRGQDEEALMFYRRAVEIGPDFPGSYYNIASILQEKRQFDEALTYYRKALELNPSCADIYNSMGVVFQSKGEFGEAIPYYKKAFSLDPNFAKAYYNLGNAYAHQGKSDEAELYLRRSLQIDPKQLRAHDSLLMLMNYGSSYDAKTIFSEHINFAKQFEGPLRSMRTAHANEKNPDKKLKIGYVSPDFRRHSVNYFLEPVLASHSHDRYEIFCYSDVSTPDNVTERLRGYADQWHDITMMSDGKAAELVRKDGVDILVDLAGHTGQNRILLFALKPAPLQVNWLGYPNTTGLSTVDYRFVDRYTDPPGLTDPFYTEELLRLPDSFLCYQPDDDSPDVGDLPSPKLGRITFGSFNVFPKVSPKTVELWSAILRALPDSRLVLKTKNFSDRSTCEHAIEMFTANGVSHDRIELISHTSSFIEHLDTYKLVDIGLDTFPYNGATTTCEALWMGVPVITLSGATHVSRVGTSLLTNIGLPELIAGTDEEYLHIALRLAKDRDGLGLLRKKLRGMMTNSLLTDARRFILILEECYRGIWENWCRGL